MSTGGSPAGEESRLRVVLLGEGECAVEHRRKGARLRTSRPAAFGGSGSSFSATDLVAAALGCCIATDLEFLARRYGIAPEEVEVSVVKILSARPRGITALDVNVDLPAGVGGARAARLRRVADGCVVRRLLSPSIPVRIRVRCGTETFTEPP